MPRGRFSRIRFIGYALPTTPARLVTFGDPSGAGAMAGLYAANSRPEADIAARVAILKEAVNCAKKQLPANENPETIVNVFMAPEFFFHGTEGPYLFKPGAIDPAEKILRRIEKEFPSNDYPNWLFVAGTVVTARVRDIKKIYKSASASARNRIVATLAKEWTTAPDSMKEVVFNTLTEFIKNCHAAPMLEVRNRALVVSHAGFLSCSSGRAFGCTALTTDKRLSSNEDFILYPVSPSKKNKCCYRTNDRLSTG